MYGDCCCGGSGCGEGRGHSRGRGEARMAGWGHEGPPPFHGVYGGPTKAERKESLEALKKHLEDRLSEVSEELSSL